MLLALVFVVQLTNAIMVLAVPPPRPDVYRLEDVVKVLKGDRSAKALEGLKVSVRSHPPGTSAGQSRAPGRGPDLDRMIVDSLADQLGVPKTQIQLETTRGLFILRLRHEFFEPRMRQPPSQRNNADGPFGGGGQFDARPPPDGQAPGARGDQGAGPGGPGAPADDDGRFGPGPRFGGGGPPVIAPFKIGLMQGDGRWLIVESRGSFPSPWQQRVLLWLVITASLCVPLAWAYARWLAAPIRRFAEAADRLGGDPSASEVEVSGPAEVRMAGEAFNRMQERLQRYVENRTTIVGAVAHDLRTPLARMRFLLETPTEDMRVRLAREIDEMDAMVGATMAFVRDSTTKAVRADMDLSSLLESLADDAAEEGHAVCASEMPQAVVHADPVGLRRLFDNLIRNGVKFASDVTVDLRIEGGDAVVEVADNGPGLPPHDLERVFEPFYRSEASRNRETGGIGLGLAVVRSIARAHGGDATMHNRPGGGLICRVRLPLRRPSAGRPA
ncbi:ATP-binding protein [Phenylobacterium sp.]|uniref:ATP-binding protein n=1 Tax=Phenylobacterium sp. TaxID=1871053 RepID=UPI0035B12CEE